MPRSRWLVPALAAAAVGTPLAPAHAQTAPGPAPLAAQIVVSPRAVTLGQPATVTVTGTPGGLARLHAYSRPDTSYDVVRAARLDEAGRVSWTITPRGNTRVYATVETPGREPLPGPQPPEVRQSPSATVNVAFRVSIGVRHHGGTYRFSGAVQPGYGGLPVTLLRTLPGGGAAVVGRTRTTRSGTWVVDRRFTGSGTFGFYAVTGTSPDNVTGTSRAYGLAVRRSAAAPAGTCG